MPASLQRANKSENAEDVVNPDCLDVDSGSNSDAIEAEDKVPDTSNGFDAPSSPVLVNPGAQASTGQTRQWSSCPNSTDQDSLDAWWRDGDGLEGGDDSVGRDNDGGDDKFGWDGIDGHQGGEGSDGGSERHGCAGKPDGKPDGGGGHHDWDGGAVCDSWDGGGRHDCDGGGGLHDWDGIDGHQRADGSDGGSGMYDCVGKPGRHNWDGGGGHHNWDGGGVGGGRHGWDGSGGRHDWDRCGWDVSEGRCGWDGGGRRTWHGGDDGGRTWLCGDDWNDCDGGGGRHGWDAIDVHQGGEGSDGGSASHDCAGKPGHHNWHGGGGRHDWDGGGVCHDWDSGGRHDCDGGGGRQGWDGSGGRHGWDHCGWDVSEGRCGWDGSGGRTGHGSDDGGRTSLGGDGWSYWSESGRSDWSSNKWHVSGHPAASSAWSKPSCSSSGDVPWNPPGGESVGDDVSSYQTFCPTASRTTPLVAEDERGSHSARFGNDAFSDKTGHQLVKSDTAHYPDKDMADMFYFLEKAREVDGLGKLGEAAELVKRKYLEALLAKTTTLAETVNSAARQLQYTNANLPPAMAILQHSRNVILKLPQVNPRFSLTKLTRFHSSATTQVDESECENWLTHQLNMSKDDVPEHVQKDLIALTKGLRKQILVNTKFICENGKGTVYKVTYMMKMDGGQAYIALVVFGASFGVDSEMTTTELKEGDAGGLVTAAGESFAVPASRSGTPAMSGEDIRTFIDYLEGLAAQQIWDQASPAQRMTVEGIDDSQDSAKITSASVGLAQEATRAAKLTLVATQERALQVKMDLDALQSTCQSAAAESKSNLVAAQERASQVKTDLDALQSTCQSAVAESMETRRKVDALEAATHNVESKVAILGKKEFYIVTKIHKRKKDIEGFVGHVAECGLDCQGQVLFDQIQLSHRLSSLQDPPQRCMACFAH